MVGSIRHYTWRLEQRVESSHLEQQAWSRERLEVVRIFKLSKLAHGSILPPARLHLLSLPKYSYRLTTTMVYVKRLCIINQGQCMDYELSLGWIYLLALFGLLSFFGQCSPPVFHILLELKLSARYTGKTVPPTSHCWNRKSPGQWVKTDLPLSPCTKVHLKKLNSTPKMLKSLEENIGNICIKK